jgi:hypothetical protein
MLGSKWAWIRWLLLAGVSVGAIRIGIALALPILPTPFAWGGSIMLGLALVLLLVPLPHEAQMAWREPTTGPGALPPEC